MSDSLVLSNVYAAYTASNQTEKNVTELSQLAKKEKVTEQKEENNKVSHMDKVVLSEEALDRLRSMSLATDAE